MNEEVIKEDRETWYFNWDLKDGRILKERE